jgi:hypothetical protein
MKNGFLQCTLDQIVVDRGSRHSQKQRELFPMSQQVGDRLPQTGVRLRSPLLELDIRLGAQFVHHRPTMLLVEVKTLVR